MPSTINAITTGTGGVITAGDTSGNLSLQSNGSTVLAMTSSGVAITGTLSATGTSFGLATATVQTTGFTATAGSIYPCNTTSSAFTVTLPASPTRGDQVGIIDYAGTFATNNVTVSPNGGKIQGSANNALMSTNREAVVITYVDATQGWLPYSVAYTSSNPLPAQYTISYLVVAGGGGGGSVAGGGAGGYRTSTLTVFGSTSYTITVGAGGGSQTVGNDSVFSTITSLGGGRAGIANSPSFIGGTGGSGGGSGYAAGGTGTTSPGGVGTPGQGNNGGGHTAFPGGAGGGGGGAGAVGTANTGGGVGGNGGDGTASSITGSSVTRGGGGAGWGEVAPYNGTAGTGGGGAVSTAGTANTGGGGGAAGPAASGAGGSGVVILSMLTSDYSGTTTGSPTVTTSGSNTILTYTGSGTYTA